MAESNRAAGSTYILCRAGFGRGFHTGFGLAAAAVHDDAGVVVVGHKLCVAYCELRDESIQLIVQRGIGGIKLVGELLGGGAAGGYGFARFAQARGVGVNFCLQVREFGGGHAKGREVGQILGRGGVDVARGVGGSGVASAAGWANGVASGVVAGKRENKSAV